MDNGAACCPSRIKASDDRQTPSAARDLRRRGRRRASRRRAVGASAPRTERPGDLSRRRQGGRGDGGGGGTTLSRPAWTCSVEAHGHRHDPPRSWCADAADQGGRGRPSGARRGRTEGRGGKPAPGRGRRCRRSPAGAAVGRRFGELDRTGSRRVVRAETADHPGAAALRRADRRGQHRAQAPVADQGRTTRPRRAPRRHRDAGNIRRAA